MVTAHCRSISPPTNSTGLVWGVGGSGTPTTQQGVLFAPKKCLGCAINIRNPSHAKICFIYIYCLGDLFFSPAGAPFLGLLVYNEAISDGEDTQIWWYTTHCMYLGGPLEERLICPRRKKANVVVVLFESFPQINDHPPRRVSEK